MKAIVQEKRGFVKYVVEFVSHRLVNRSLQ